MFQLGLHYEVNYFFTRRPRAQRAAVMLSTTSKLQPSSTVTGPNLVSTEAGFQAVSFPSKAWPKEPPSIFPPQALRNSKKIILSTRNNYIYLLLSQTASVQQNKHSKHGFFYCFLMKSDTNFCPRQNKSPGAHYTSTSNVSPPMLFGFVACVKKQRGILNNPSFPKNN